MALCHPRSWPIAILSALALALTAAPLGTAPAAADAGPYIVSVSPRGSAMACRPTKPCSLTGARDKVREILAEGIDRDVVVQLRGGTYPLSETLELDARDSGSAEHPVRWVGTGAGARIIGGRTLSGSWHPTRTDPSIMVTDVPAGIDFDELFVNDERQVLARYPNYDESAPRLEGTTTLSTLDSRSSGWQDPTTGYVRAMHCHDWGSVSFTITGRVGDELGLHFVGDNNRPQDCGDSALPLKRDAVLVENIREELDSAGEWFLDRTRNKLFLKPPAGVDLASATIETGELDQLVTLTGASPAEPVHDITLENLHFERTHRTLFDSTFEGLSRGDWSVVRKGAAYLTNARDITITRSTFEDLGGNGVFMDGYNERNSVTRSTFDSNGATDVQVVGSPSAVRDYAGNYFTTPRITDLGSGPKTEDYPRDILIGGNVMRNNGRYEKQTSSVNISVALDVTVRGNSLSDSPRACLNFSDNTWGGHLIQDNDIFDCVRETGDNGSINSWGRSRFWRTGASSNRFASLAEGVTFRGNTGGELTTDQARSMMHLDVIKPITIDHNRFWHDGDWAIDLDDGSSNFVITNNVLLKGGIKLRDGFERTLHNNLILDGRTFEQVSYMPGGDVIERNVTPEPARVGLPGPLALAVAAARGTHAAPLAELGVAAGSGRELLDEPCDTWVALPDDLAPGRHLALRVVGDSMLPLLHSGDVVLVDLDRPAHTGEVAVARHPEHGYVVKRLARAAGGTALALVSLNPAYQPLELAAAPGAVLGPVVLRWCLHGPAKPGVAPRT